MKNISNAHKNIQLNIINMNNYTISNNTIIFKCDFVEPLDSSEYFNIINGLKILIFEPESLYNIPIQILPNTLTHITFGNLFDQNVVFPNSLTNLTLLNRFYIMI